MNDPSDEPLLRCTSQEIDQLRELAASTTAGIWRIKRAKALLGVLEGIRPEKLMFQVRVPVTSIVKCINNFSRLRMAYFDKPDRCPTQRESAVEKMLALLDNPRSTASGPTPPFSLRYIGTHFTVNQIRIIREMIDQEPNPVRSHIARQLCSTFNLYGTNGKPRLSVAVDILKRMTMDNLIDLPARKSAKDFHLVMPPKLVVIPQQSDAIACSNSLSFQVVLVQKPEEMALWNTMIYRHHYIPTCRLFGQQLHYLIIRKHNESCGCPDMSIPLAALSFSSSAWRVSCRDDFIGWNETQRVKNLPWVINNSRFLILPWVNIPNLASSILGAIGRRVGQDWQAQYNRRPVLMETFVECDRFMGTCYIAANWINVGTTNGYSLYGKETRSQQPAKSVLLRPLQKNFRDILCRKE
jgi:hypothetical protein